MVCDVLRVLFCGVRVLVCSMLVYVVAGFIVLALVRVLCVVFVCWDELVWCCLGLCVLFVVCCLLCARVVRVSCCVVLFCVSVWFRIARCVLLCFVLWCLYCDCSGVCLLCGSSCVCVNVDLVSLV